MAERISKSQILGLFELYCRKFGFKQSKSRPRGKQGNYAPPTPGLALDYNPTYGGWEIVGYDGKSSGVSMPITSGRYSNGEFWAVMHFAIASADAHEQRRSGTGR